MNPSRARRSRLRLEEFIEKKYGREATFRMTSTLLGGVLDMPDDVKDPEQMKKFIESISQAMEELQEENKKLKENGKDTTINGLRKVVQNGAKELIPKKYINAATSGSFKAWAREIKDYAKMAEPDIDELLNMGEEDLENKHNVDLTIGKETLDRDLHYLISRFLYGEAKLLALNAEVGEKGKEYKSGVEIYKGNLHMEIDKANT